MPPGQPVANQTLQVMSQVGDTHTKKQARGILNLKAKGSDNRPRVTSILPQKIPSIKQASMKTKNSHVLNYLARIQSRKPGMYIDMVPSELTKKRRKLTPNTKPISEAKEHDITVNNTKLKIFSYDN